MAFAGCCLIGLVFVFTRFFLDTLKKAGAIKRVGSDRGGEWLNWDVL